MGIERPYYRIVRPFLLDGSTLGSVYQYVHLWDDDFPADPRYANDRLELWRAYMLLEKDLLRLFEYIEPTDDNIQTYSHRTYELLLRAATEFETNCKRILESNGYSRSGNLNITDYFKIHQSSKLGDYGVFLTVWYPQKRLLKPFKEWATGQHSLPWYQSYNQVKHDRNREFGEASLKNVLCAVAAVFVILFSQFVFLSGLPSSSGSYLTDDNAGTISTSDHIFEVMPPNWSAQEAYEFDWDNIKNDQEPFARFSFA